MSALFQSTSVGQIELSHRVVFAPLTRLRPDVNGVPPPLAAEYYSQRGSTAGTLLISEGTIIAPKAGGLPHAPGIWSDEQIEAWKQVTTSVHEQGSYIFLQIAALGRTAIPSVLESIGAPYVSASDVQLKGASIPPRPLLQEEIHEYVQLFAVAAKNAVERAGFDGVEIHGCNADLIEQFLSNVTNKRLDDYGGSAQARMRFALEVADAVTKAVGEERVGYRISPWSTAGDLRMDDVSIKDTYTSLVTELCDRYPKLAYLHAVEPRVSGDNDIEKTSSQESNDFIRAIWSPRPFIAAGGFSRDTALKAAEAWPNQLIAFGRHFLANPDFPKRLKDDIPFNKYNRSTFYLMGDRSPLGYTDYPFAVVA